MSDQDSVALMHRVYAAVLGGDFDTFGTLVHPDMELHQGSGMPFAGTYRGVEGFMRFFTIFGETFEIEKLAPLRDYRGDDPEWVVCELEIAATVKATGKRFEGTIMEQWQFRDGKALTIKPHYFNSPLAG